MNKTLSPERSEGRVPDRTAYEQYLASWHGLTDPLSYETIPLSYEQWLRKGHTQIQPTPHHSPNPKDQIGITKLPLHLIPAPALARLSKVMELGAKKYGPYNWRETEVNLTVYLTAALRHIYSILDGENIDIESNQHHAAHAMACMAIILDAIELNKLLDDRPTPGNFAQLITKLQEKI